MKLLRLLLFPFSILYGIVIHFRNYAYNKGILNTSTFSIPVISIGNLAVGGTGKSPMAEYIIRLLKDQYQVATLSRGYGRRTKGFIVLSKHTTAEEAGDEPVQFKQKFPSVNVAVCEDRANGIRQLEGFHDLILLDDAYQHRAVSPGLSLLLFDYSSLFSRQFLLPAGNLREPLSQRKRADIIVVTKTPANLSATEKAAALARVRPFPNQKTFFSYLAYGDLISLANGGLLPLSTLDSSTEIILLTGIANPVPLLLELSNYPCSIIQHQYPDHHRFSRQNIAKLVRSFSGIKANSKFIITTEKDAQRLRLPELQDLLVDLPIYFLPVQARIHQPEEEQFNLIIKNYVAKHLQHDRIH